MKYTEYELGQINIEVIDGDRGKNYPHQDELLREGSCVFLSANNVTSSGFKFDSVVFITEEKDKILRNGKLVRNDIVITTRGTVGNVGLFDSSVPFTDMRINSGMLIVRCGEGVDCRYLYHVLRGSSFQQQILQVRSGTAQPQLPKSHFLRMKVELPPIDIQQKIAKILGTVDKKIKNNEEINENLSDQIQAIYSNEFDPITHTPSGILADICSYSSDRIPVSELSLSTYYSTENMQPNKMGSVDATSLPSITQTTGCHKGDVLISNIRPYFKKIVYVTDNSCGCSTDVLCFVPMEDQYSAFLFGTLYMDRFFDYMVTGSKGTKMPRGDKQQIMNYPIVLPNKESLDLFNGLVVPMLDQIASNRIENSRLAALRDALLPKLMSGELDVSDIDL